STVKSLQMQLTSDTVSCSPLLNFCSILFLNKHFLTTFANFSFGWRELLVICDIVDQNAVINSPYIFSFKPSKRWLASKWSLVFFCLKIFFENCIAFCRNRNKCQYSRIFSMVGVFASVFL